MAASSIEWTETVWNPVTGCTKYSEGCANCYANTFAKRLKAMGCPRYANGFEVTIHRDLFERPLTWTKPKRIFVNSMSDLFHEDIPEEDILHIFSVMNRADWHVFQVLTKRAERLKNLSKSIVWTPNIWMGVSIENQKTISRADALKSTGAAVKFISAEPLLEDISSINLNGIDWLIVGGESGPGCRPLKEEWVLRIRDKAFQSNTAFFFKQWGGIRKKKTGSLLQGYEYKAYPKIASA
ncbi:MAG: phage Gp37/Gp68 family protein [Lachnospiraceae bacterium]|nr:phage Gp37/Gp68 family protein [Lachnospiraceae bacterium]